MVSDNSNLKNKNKISTGLIISREQLEKSFFPSEVIQEIANLPFYLFIFISREDIVKVSCFPTKTNVIKKILLKLEEFSPEIVNGISKIMNQLNLSEDVLHTTGICYELENCFYETYVMGEKIVSGKLNEDLIKNEFLAIPKVNDVSIEDVPTKK